MLHAPTCIRPSMRKDWLSLHARRPLKENFGLHFTPTLEHHRSLLRPRLGGATRCDAARLLLSDSPCAQCSNAVAW